MLHKNAAQRLKLHFKEKLKPAQRQWVMLGGLCVVGLGAIGAVTMVGDAVDGKQAKAQANKVDAELLGVQADKPKGKPEAILGSGEQVRPADAWVAQAGKEVEQLKRDREDQRRKLEAQERASKEMMGRFEELQRRLSSREFRGAAAPAASAVAGAGSASAAASVAERPAVAAAREPKPPAPQAAAKPAAPTPPLSGLPPLPPPPRPSAGAYNAGEPLALGSAPAQASLTRVSLSGGAATGVAAGPAGAGTAATGGASAEAGRSDMGASGHSLDNFLPVSFTRAILLGGLDAPTGGQSQSNPHPVLLRLEDNAMLPNRFRGQVRECLVIGAGYGDLSSERAYIRTERLSCVRHDGTAIEVKIKGSVFGEDGKVGVRGRLVSKQGQVLANALIAGVVGGIGSGIQGRYTQNSSSALGNVSTVDPNHAMEAGMGQGVGKALDRLAQYYISLAEKMFPIVEVDAGRVVDVVLTEGAVLDTPLTSSRGGGKTPTRGPALPAAPAARHYYTGVQDDD